MHRRYAPVLPSQRSQAILHRPFCPFKKEIPMKVNAGLWIDHLKALVVITFDGGERRLEILSNVKPLPGRTNGRQAMVSAMGQFNGFYTAVICAIRDAESIVIFGPGEAKDDLNRRLARARLGDKVMSLESADRMTDLQIATKVRAFFQSPLAKLQTS